MPTAPSKEHRPHPDMVYLPGGTFAMGSARFYPEERPVHDVEVDGFYIDRTPVTNAAFATFVAETGYVTLAEIAPDPHDYPDAAPEMLRRGSLVFTPPRHPVDLNNHALWWRFVFEADWRHPNGPHSNLEGLDDHPVVHVAHADAAAYAAWAGKALPTEAEWEFAARGGTDGDYAWGDTLSPNGRLMANTWHGRFPFENTGLDGYERTSPVGAFPANDFGLVDMIGNVWEWTADLWSSHATAATSPCCASHNRDGGGEVQNDCPSPGGWPIPRRVLKGGSHLCAPNYCRRYRPAARHAQPVDTSTSHVGFRCVRRPV